MKQLFKRMDKPLFFITLGMFVFGAIMILSASSMESFARHGASSFNFFIRQVAFLIAGAIGFIILIMIPIRKLTKLAPLIIVGSVVLLFMVNIYGYATNNAVRWLPTGLFGFNIQPSEFAKIGVIIFLAWFFAVNKDRLNKLNTVIIAFVPIALICMSVFFQPDLGTTMIIAGISLLMFFAVPGAQKVKKQIAVIMAGAVVLMVGLIMLLGPHILSGNQLSRFNFLRPCDRYFEVTGYQVCNGFIAINSGGLIGQGFANSSQKHLYLPEGYTDFIFPIIIEELGFVSAILIMLAYAAIIARLLIISKKSKHLEGAYIAYGVAIYIFLHLVINIGGFTGLIPLSGVPLPFLSYGGSIAIALIAALALAQRVAIESNAKPKRKKVETTN